MYLSASFILMVVVAILYYQNQKSLFLDLIKSDMHNVSSSIASKVISSHMKVKSLEYNKIITNRAYKIAFYDENKEKTFGNFNKKIDFEKDFFKYNDRYILIDDSTYGHLGVYYIAIEENLYFDKIKKLESNILLLFMIIYSVIIFIGLFLSRLFSKPVKEERERLNRFIKDTTHELNTPVSALLMSTESNILNEKQIERVRLSARRISEIYKDLTYIFLENSKNEKVVKKLDLNICINKQLEYFEVLAIKKKINIVTNLENFQYNINEDDFIRLFNNLISNAIKYNIFGGNITITLKNGILTISDTGMGIEKEKLKRIFSRYYRATTEQGGFGIGLNIVSRMCDHYNINITVQSTIKKETTFILTF